MKFKNDAVKARVFTLVAMVLTLAALAFPGIAQAAGTGGPLADVYTSLTTWVQGDVGKTIAMGMILVGIVAGIARQSLMAFAVGIGAGLGLYNAPTIVDTVFQATIHAGMLR